MSPGFGRKILLGVLLFIFVAGVAVFAFLRSMQGAGEDPAFFESEIAAFEAQDRESAPAPGAIVFVGSSSIRFWSTLAEDMAPLRVLNRGFGGAHLSHVIHNADRIVLPYQPQAIVLYAGDNDIGAGKSLETVVSDFETFVGLVHAKLPGTPIYFLPIKPSKLRWSMWPEMARTNERIAEIIASDPMLYSLDTASVLLDEDGEPRDDVFLFDGLHLNAKGYAAWTEVVAPALRSAFGKPSSVPTR
jgi:lysophospholipase L1-like esterase